MAKFNSWSNQRRLDGMRGFAMTCAAFVLCIFSFSAVAQTAFEFEDPLEEMRIKVEKEGPKSLTAPAEASDPSGNWQARAKFTPTTKAKGPITIFAEQLGLSTAGVVGLGVLGLAGLLLGFIWLFTRRSSARSSKRKNSDLYAVADGARGRRMLESGAKVTRNRKEFLDTTEDSKTAVQSSIVSRAARLVENEEGDDNEYILDDEIVSRADTRVAETKVTQSLPDDPDTWKRPNLERLKASIRDDWSKKEEPPVNPEAAKLRSEAEVFADLFGDDVPPSAVKTDGPKSSILEIIDNYEDGDDKGTSPITSLQHAAEKSANIEPATNVVRDALPNRDDALRRIRALRESVKAS